MKLRVIKRACDRRIRRWTLRWEFLRMDGYWTAHQVVRLRRDPWQVFLRPRA